MPLARGHRLGIYEIVGSLGAGGMGEVYRAIDTSLQREVAIKVLPDAFAGDPERVQRLTREARTLAALNHPNIAHIHGLDDTGSGRAVIMELVHGEDLSERIARGALPMAEALPIARQLAEALEAAHEQGIVHRDLKPANIKVRPDGTVKVLDFGLAKAVAPGGLQAAVTESPTFSAGPSEYGLILGTAAYMAPEQARGRSVDKRADIWAFGAVLYEMLTGTRAFQGDAVPEVLAAVLRREIDWSRLPADTPPQLRQLLDRCLMTDVRERLRDIGEARVALAAIERGGSDVNLTPVRANGRTQAAGWREGLAWVMAAVAVASAVYFAIGARPGRRAADGSGVTRLSVLPPPGARVNPDSANVAISPDGRSVILVVGRGIAAENQLWVRSLDSPQPRRIESGDGVSLPFWSPDSTRIGFFADRKLQVVAASGGPAQVICDAPFGRGGTWNSANVIVFAPDAQGPLYRVPASGGTPTPVTRLDAGKNARGHRFPHFLPDGDRFLFAAVPGTDGAFEIFAGSLQNPDAPVLVGSMETAPVYAEPGWLLFARQGVLTAQRFDAKTLQLGSDATALGDQPGIGPSSAAYEAGPRLSVSRTGALAYYLPVAAEIQVQWMDASGGRGAAIAVPPARYTGVALAPDAGRAVLVRDGPGGNSSLWLVDLARSGAIPLATEGQNTSPVWSPDGKQVAFARDRGGQREFYVKSIADSTPERRIATFNDASAEPRGWSNDGDWILFSRVDPVTRWNVYRLRASGSGEPERLVDGPTVEIGGRTSPDDRWLAYLSDETGRLDVFIRSMDRSGPKLQVSTGGVLTGWWTRDGREFLLLKHDRTLWRVPVRLGEATPTLAPARQVGAFPAGVITMDLARDGRFIALVAERSDAGTVAVVQGWQALVAAR